MVKYLESAVLFLHYKLYSCELWLDACVLEQTVKENKTCSAE